MNAPTVAEFFAGIGLVRLGLEHAGFETVWANDIDPGKATMYRGHFRDQVDHYQCGDIADVDADDLPDVDLAWASFPCVDVSVAGARAGLAGAQTGLFWQFVRILADLDPLYRRPSVIALENVPGLATSNGGRDLADAIRALNGLGYSIDVLNVDGRHFVPQSRPRLFIVGALNPRTVPLYGTGRAAIGAGPASLRPASLDRLYAEHTMHRAVLPDPGPLLTSGLAYYVEQIPLDHPAWWNASRTRKAIDTLAPAHRERLDHMSAAAAHTAQYRTAYRRTRNGAPVWEIRADGIAGCLRTAAGGSSRQAVVRVDAGSVHMRWMTGREYAHLMGASDYTLDGLTDSQIVQGFGDAVVVDVACWLAKHYLRPLVNGHAAALQPAGETHR